MDKKQKTVINAEEEHLAAMSTTTTTTKTKIVKKSMKSSTKTKEIKSSTPQLAVIDLSKKVEKEEISDVAASRKKVKSKEIKSSSPQPALIDIPKQVEEEEVSDVAVPRKKVKSKKSKKCEYDNQNISVKSSLNKFDAMQKRNLIHVRSSNTGKAQEMFSNPQDEQQTSCRMCNKPVYKMEEVKAEKSIYHKNCLRCRECSKQLKSDNYQSHEGQLYCIVHFKLLFAPKVVEEVESKPKGKAELIIRESQPTELPPGVARASDKADLGLEELQQLNVRARFQAFENASQKKEEIEEQKMEQRKNTSVKRSASILSKLVKLQQHGLNSSSSIDRGIEEEEAESDGTQSDEEDIEEEDEDSALVRSKRRTQKERPVGMSEEAMNDIKTRFEKGHMLSKEERREERKQEIQNIRSRLFMGKQAKIKEMYQQAVADSEQRTSSKMNEDAAGFGEAAKSIKERFEKGEMFKDKATDGDGGLMEDADVFESAISRKSRSIFMELDANVSSNTHEDAHELQKTRSGQLRKCPSQFDQENDANVVDVVKYDEKSEDVKVATSELSEKFKFFETYRPQEGEKRIFRMTPPREGVVKMPTPDEESEEESKPTFNDNVLQKTQTTSTMLNKFREMEQNKRQNGATKGPKPLKSFTPPPDDRRNYYEGQNSEEEESDDSEENDSADDDEVQQEYAKLTATDEALREAQNAARAKQLRAKFEKWQANEIERELNEGRVDVYSQQVSDDSTIESAKSIRERFESMKNFDRKSPTGPRHQVNRFV